MSRYLLQLSVGPVQDFIAAARRTRDLWFGSTLLSEISKAAAKSIHDTGGFLIFPYSDNLNKDLESGSSFNVANVILAEVNADGEEQVKKISRDAEKMASARWKKFAREAHEKMRSGVDDKKWRYQENMKMIEFYSAWHPFEDERKYKIVRQKVADLLAARKNLRDFEQWQGEFGVPKSSLDGRRDSVLKKHEASLNLSGVRVKAGEALDLIGCVKRAAGGNESFPSVVNIALDPWIRGLVKKGTEMAEMCEHCEELVSTYSVLSRPKDANAFFPYDATALLPSRYHEFEEEASDPEAVRTITEKMKRAMQKLHRFHKPMDPYLAVLVADGDRMGKAISVIKSPDAHREFSNTLSCFAENARKVVTTYSGCCVYTGGDDVLAFLPVDKAVPCARELHDEFGRLWTEKDWNFKPPTLSVGISIAHALEDLEDILNFGREAEKKAKNASTDEGSDDRDGLAVTIRARANSTLFIREQWKEYSADPVKKPLAELSPDQRLSFWIRRFSQEQIPTRFPYDLMGILNFYENWDDKTSLDMAMRSDVMRIIKRKGLKLTKEDEKRVRDYVECVIKESNVSIKRLAEELLVAQWIEAAHVAAGGDNDGGV